MPRGHKTKNSGRRSATLTENGSEKPASPVVYNSLKDEVRDVLLGVIRDGGAPASAKASAARTLMEFFGDDGSDSSRPASEMTVEQIDAEIRRVGANALDKPHQ